LETSSSSKVNSSPKVIKRYQNRKLYDTQQSCYVTLEDIAKMIRASEEVTIVDNKTKRDITASTLAQIIFEAEKKASEYAPLKVLRDIIQTGNGSMSSYLAKLNVFEPSEIRRELDRSAPIEAEPKSYDDLKSSIDQRISSAANSLNESANTTLPTSSQNAIEITPELPGARSFEN